ncbi:MAG: hypothetical protein ACPGED_03615, partial [Flavobacteriales bacterium]
KMEFNQEYVANLKLILNAENERISRSEFVDAEGGRHHFPDHLIAELVKLDLIETEGDDDSLFYLTTEGYNYLEENQRNEDLQRGQFVSDFNPSNNQNELEGTNRSRFYYVGLLVLGISVTALKFVKQQTSNYDIDQGMRHEWMMNMSKKNIILMRDSLHRELNIDSIMQVINADTIELKPPSIEEE